MKEFQFKNQKASAKCCPLTLSDDNLKEMDSLQKECNGLNLEQDACNSENVKKIQYKCKKYGMVICNKQEIDAMENKCREYGFRFRNNEGVVNANSNYICHVDNFDNFNKECNNLGIDDCSVDNLTNAKLSKIKQNAKSISTIVENINMVNKIQQLFERNFNQIAKDTKYLNIITKIMGSFISIVIFIVMIKMIF
jgi:hypothetical protein